MSNIITRTLRKLIASAVDEALDARQETTQRTKKAERPKRQQQQSQQLQIDDIVVEDSLRTVSARQASDLLGLAPKTVQRACAEGRVPSAYRDEKGYWRIPLGELQSGPLTKIHPRPTRQRRDK